MEVMDESRAALYRATYDVPEHGIRRGQYIRVMPTSAGPQVAVTELRDRHALVRLVGDGHLDHFDLVEGNRRVLSMVNGYRSQLEDGGMPAEEAGALADRLHGRIQGAIRRGHLTLVP